MASIERQPLVVPDRISVDNATLAFAALLRAISLGQADRAEQIIVGTPFRMIAYRTRVSDGCEALHFEIRLKALVA